MYLYLSVFIRVSVCGRNQRVLVFTVSLFGGLYTWLFVRLSVHLSLSVYASIVSRYASTNRTSVLGFYLCLFLYLSLPVFRCVARAYTVNSKHGQTSTAEHDEKNTNYMTITRTARVIPEVERLFWFRYALLRVLSYAAYLPHLIISLVS